MVVTDIHPNLLNYLTAVKPLCSCDMDSVDFIWSGVPSNIQMCGFKL